MFIKENTITLHDYWHTVVVKKVAGSAPTIAVKEHEMNIDETDGLIKILVAARRFAVMLDDGFEINGLGQINILLIKDTL